MTAATVELRVRILQTSIDAAGVVQDGSRRANHNARSYRTDQGPAVRHDVMECDNQLLCQKHQRNITAHHRMQSPRWAGACSCSGLGGESA